MVAGYEDLLEGIYRQKTARRPGYEPAVAAGLGVKQPAG